MNIDKRFQDPGGVYRAKAHFDKLRKDKLRKNSKVKFKFIESYSKPELEKKVDKFLAGDIKLVDWKFNSYDGYYMFTCTYQELPSLD